MLNKKMLLLVTSVTLLSLSQSTIVSAEVSNEETVFIVDPSTAEEEAIEDNYELEEVETLDENYSYPSNRSDLDPVVEPRSFSTRVADNFLLITEKNRPKSNFIDVSSHNGDISVEEYKIMKSYGVTGVVVKLTESTNYKNPYAKNQIKNAKDAGLLVSAYHYSWFKSETQAIAEANYFADMAVELNLPKTTVLVNDIEQHDLKYLNTNTENSLYFEKQLNMRGFKQVNHYIGKHWINENRIDPNKLGREKVWVAAYPYNPTYQENTEYGAWQWTSSMSFPGVHGAYDMSSDYQGNFSIPPQGKYITDGRYVKISKKGYSTYSNFDWKYRDSTDNLIGNKYEVRGRYEHINGSTYYSLYDNKGQWAGYLNADATVTLKGAQGDYITDGRYVSVQKKNYSIWKNFDFNQTELNTTDVFEKTYLAKGKYEHFNGSTYLSLYDGQNKWLGYLNADAIKTAPSKNGLYLTDGRYATITSTGYNTWSNFNWSFMHSPEKIHENTYVVKGRYENFNGSTYLSLFDNKGEWYGYINAKGVTFSDKPQGAYMKETRYASIVDPTDVLYSDFDGKVRQSTEKIYRNNYYAKGKYHHVTGDVYYSLYNQNNVWQGYANEDIVRLTNNAQGPFISINKEVKIINKNYTIWENFNWEKKGTSDQFYNENVIAKGEYHHVNGDIYYSLYDNHNKWIGYLNKNATKEIN